MLEILNKVKIAILSFIIGSIAGIIALSVYNRNQDTIAVVTNISDPVYDWSHDPGTANNEQLKSWASSPIKLSYKLGIANNGLTPLYVTASDANKTTRETWGIRTQNESLKNFGASLMISPRGNLYGSGIYNTGIFFISVGACIPVHNFMSGSNYDIFAGGGVWF